MRCSVCAGTQFVDHAILWDGLVNEWQLSPHERAYVDRQQGTMCAGCGANLRSMALADALCKTFGTSLPLGAFVRTPEAQQIRILEINAAGSLTATLKNMAGHVYGEYPELDMSNLSFPEASFDIVCHSDTLEHVPNPRHALGECRRVLKPGGRLCFTIPIIVGRLSRDRTGLAKSYHGTPTLGRDDFVVHTEFGADAWTYLIDAGFSNVAFSAFEFPAGLALTASR